MRELTLVASESDGTVLVFSAPQDTDNQQDDATGGAEKFVFPLTDDAKKNLSTLLDLHQDSGVTPVTPTVPAPQSVPTVSTVADAPSHPLTLPVKEIQTRIRQGEDPEKLAVDNGMLISQIEPFAHPILQERNYITSMARASNPVGDDGPTALTLWEMLATALAARGHSLNETDWDSYQNPAGQWVVTVTWNKTGSPSVAEFQYTKDRTGPDTTRPLNPVAKDLIDPQFSQPIRTVNSVSLIGVTDPKLDQQPWNDPARGTAAAKDTDEPTLDSGVLEFTGGARTESATPPETSEKEKPARKSTKKTPAKAPDTPTRKANRREKITTPHWEDVLLGTRTTTPDE